MGWSGHEGGSDAAAKALAERARNGDQAALDQLMTAAGMKGANTGAWRPDHRNAAIDAFNSLGIGSVAPMKNPHHGLGGLLGKALKFASPFAGLIPGVGPMLGAGLAAGGSALGGAASGDKFNLGKTLAAGAAGYAGGEANPFGGRNAAEEMARNGFISAPGRLGGGSVPPLDPGMSGGGGGILGGFKTPGGGWDINKILNTVGTIGGGIQAANTQNQANQQREGAISGATQDYAGRAPLRAAGQAGLLSLNQIKRPDLTSTFADVGNPFYRKPQPLGAGY